jgi:cation diffusion facilitator CzcD-associated flavoprotein CzcO
MVVCGIDRGDSAIRTGEELTEMAAERRIKTDAVVVGAGFAGLYALYRLRKLNMSVAAFEAGGDVGGTWYWNRYPGARCDIESMQYSYSFSPELEQEWKWSEVFASQREILAYLNHVADRFDLRRDIKFDTKVNSAVYDASTRRWTVKTDQGDEVSCGFLITAVGCLSEAQLPDVPGRNLFKGEIYHTGRWPQRPVDFSGKRVAVIGTGSSGIQVIPAIAELADHVTVLQRTANFSIPARNRPMTEEYERHWKDNYGELRAKARLGRSATLYDANNISALAVSDEERRQEFEARWIKGGANFLAAYNDIIFNIEANRTAAEFVAERIRETVKDPAAARTLLPKNLPIGAKRICLDSNYYETFNRPNVSLVDITDDPITEFTEGEIHTAGHSIPVDCVVLATGYDAVTGALLSLNIAGLEGLPLRAKWAEGPQAYLGLMTAGYPNLFMITGPGSPSVLANVVMAIEQHVDFIAECLAYMRANGFDLIEADPTAEEAWLQHVEEASKLTVYSLAKTWYNGGNIQGKPRRFLPYIGGFAPYCRKCEEVVANGYEGFRMRGAAGDRSTAAA